jgi:hypothetical protein
MGYRGVQRTCNTPLNDWMLVSLSLDARLSLWHGSVFDRIEGISVRQGSVFGLVRMLGVLGSLFFGCSA